MDVVIRHGGTRGGVIRCGGVSRNRGMSGGGGMCRSRWVIRGAGGSGQTGGWMSGRGDQVWRDMERLGEE